MERTDHYNNGFASFPHMRILYPTDPEEEKEWLAGWYDASAEVHDDLIEPDGRDNWLWKYHQSTRGNNQCE